MPTAPNPTTGFMLIVPRNEIEPTGLSVEAAFQMIVSAGVAVPPTLRLPVNVAHEGEPNGGGSIERQVRIATEEPSPRWTEAST